MRNRVTDDIIGNKFNKLTVREFVGIKHKQSMYRCECECGNEIVTYRGHITRGHTKSCGCLTKNRKRSKGIHGFARRGFKRIPEYPVWVGMRRRCNNPNDEKYPRYGGRGIKVCERWNSFENFIEDMGRRPGPEYSIDRIDNNGNYEPGNCRWATSKEQSRNTVQNRFLEFNDEVFCVTDWAIKVDITRGVLHSRLERGWTIEKALTTPLRKNNSRHEFNGVMKTISEWAEEYGINYDTLHDRLKRGWSIEKALTTPVREKKKRNKK